MSAPIPGKAVELYFYAASTFGDADGQFRLGRMLLEGKGAPRDPRQAARWLQLAAQKSHHQAQAVLGHMLFTGRDVPRAAPRGLMFLTLAKEAASRERALDQRDVRGGHAPGLGRRARGGAADGRDLDQDRPPVREARR
jgi:TPR repeat protein